MSYTKGPWKAVRTVADDFSIISMSPDVGWGPLAKVLNPIEGELSPLEVEDNANLIAAAPEMYEALKAILEETENLIGNGNLEALYVSKSFAKLHKALAKVEGK